MKNKMYKLYSWVGIVIILFSIVAHNQVIAQAGSDILSQEEQIIAAVSPAPQAYRSEAKVIGYNSDLELVTIREGSNNLICLADDPRNNDFHVACYHKDLEPFMKRGRELRAMGKPTDEVDKIRNEEIESGDLEMPRKPMALYSLSGGEKAFNYEEKRVNKASRLYVIYIPFATKFSTGLPTQPIAKGAPWLMDAGTPWAHIMVMTGESGG